MWDTLQNDLLFLIGTPAQSRPNVMWETLQKDLWFLIGTPAQSRPNVMWDTLQNDLWYTLPKADRTLCGIHYKMICGSLSVPCPKQTERYVGYITK